MGVTVVQTKIARWQGGDPNPVERTITLDAAPTEGNLIFLFVKGTYGATLSAPLPTGFIEVHSHYVDSQSYNRGSAMYAKVAGASESATITAQVYWDWKAILAIELESDDGWPEITEAADILDAVANTNNTDDVPSVTPTAGAKVLLLHCGSYWDSTTSYSWPSGYTHIYAGSPGGDMGMAVCYQYVESASGSYGGAATISTWAPKGSQLALLLPEGGGGGARSQAIIIQ